MMSADGNMENIRKTIEKIVNGADLSKLSAKVVREEVEKTLDINLSDRVKEIDEIIMTYVLLQPSTSKNKKTKKKKRQNSGDADFKPYKTQQEKKILSTKKKADTGYTRGRILSPELSEVLNGEKRMPIHQVIQKMHKIIKERNLLDPVDKRYAILDDQLEALFGIKRFRVFGMMRFLMKHLK